MPQSDLFESVTVNKRQRIKNNGRNKQENKERWKKTLGSTHIKLSTLEDYY